MGFGNGNSYDLALSCSRICVCLWRGNLSVGNSNSVISNTPLFRTQTHFPSSNFVSVICYRLFRTPCYFEMFSVSFENAK